MSKLPPGALPPLAAAPTATALPAGALPVGAVDAVPAAFPTPMRGATELSQSPPEWLVRARQANEMLPSLVSAAVPLAVSAAGGPAGLLARAGSTVFGASVGVPMRNAGRLLLGYRERGTPYEQSLQTARDMATESGLNLGAMALGEAAQPVMRAAGQSLRAGALGPSRATLKQFPGMMETYRGSDIPVTRGVGAGTEAAERLRSGSSAITQSHIDSFDFRGGKFTLQQLGQELLDAAAANKKRPLTAQEARDLLAGLKTDLNRYLNDARTSGYATPTSQVTWTGNDLLDIRRAADAEAQGALTQQASGKRNIRANPTRAVTIGDITRRAVNSIPQVAEQNKKTQSLIGLSQAVRDAEAHAAQPRGAFGEGLRMLFGGSAGFATPGSPVERLAAGTTAYGLARLAAEPSVQSTVGRALVRNAPSDVLRYAPRVVPAAVEAMGQPEGYQELSPEEASAAARALRQHGIARARK